jgi:hypothetical protein
VARRSAHLVLASDDVGRRLAGTRRSGDPRQRRGVAPASAPLLAHDVRRDAVEPRPRIGIAAQVAAPAPCLQNTIETRSSASAASAVRRKQ